MSLKIITIHIIILSIPIILCENKIYYLSPSGEPKNEETEEMLLNSDNSEGP